jgi:2-polyprenyl-3-methyl-5-hydroxy-6-metoxy-1,4-benzoquinol methylase
MCNISCITFGAINLNKDEVFNKRIIEVGSNNVNGSLRPIYESWNPAEYVGIDIEYGPGVDIICDAEDILERFGKNSFDIVVSTELLEHVRNWRKVVSNLKNVCKPGGIIIITTRSFGHHYHGFPYDFWRYEIDDMKYIFSDCNIDKIEKDTEYPGVFLRVTKPDNFFENNLSNYQLFSIIANRIIQDIDDKTLNEFLKDYQKRQIIERNVEKIVSSFRKMINKSLVTMKKSVKFFKMNIL